MSHVIKFSLGLMAGTVALTALSANAEQHAPRPRIAAQAQAVEEAPDAVELAGLYYFAKQGQMDRVSSETRRLQLKYPNFIQPDDLFNRDETPKIDEGPLWALYEKDDYAGIEAEISRLAAAAPGWEPSDDFQEKLERRKLRFDLTEAFKAQDWPKVIAAGAAVDPKTEPDIDLLWMLIDAYRANGMSDAVVPVYRGILLRQGDDRPSVDAILITLQKAMDDFPVDELRLAIAKFATDPALGEKLHALDIDLMRREISDYVADDNPQKAPSQTAIDALRREAATAASPKDLALVGWYSLKTGKPVEAETWFRQIVKVGDDPEGIKGLFLSLKKQKKDQDAYLFATGKIDAMVNDSPFLVEALSWPFASNATGDIDPAVVKAYSAAIQRTLNADHAEELAWHAFNTKQYEAAQAWFAKAFEWKPASASLKGLVLTALRKEDKAGLERLKASYATAYPDAFADLKAIAAMQKGKAGRDVAPPAHDVEPSYLTSFKQKRYGACLADLRSLEARGALSKDAQVIRGWCQYQLSHFVEARAAFTAALEAGANNGDDAAYGLALTLLRSDLADDADQLIGRYRLNQAHDREIRGEIYWQRARAAFDRKAYQETLDALNIRMQLIPEPANLSQMRAWAHYHLGHFAQSRAIFAQLNQTTSDPGNMRGIAAIDNRFGDR